MEVHYTNTRHDQIPHAELHRRIRAPGLAFYHYFWITYWAVMAGLGVYISTEIGNFFIAAIFVGMFLFYAVRAVPYSRVWKLGVEKLSRGTAEKKIRLRVDERGLHETVDGLVESFAPWSAVRSFAVVDQHLLIELAGDLWANVPHTTVAEGNAAFEELISLLRSHDIPQRAP